MKAAISTHIPNLLLLAILTIVSCQNNSTGVTNESWKQGFHISSVNPISGRLGTEVSISGAEFSEIPSENRVTFNGIEAEVLNATADRLVVIVPGGTRPGPVEVEVDGKIAKGPDFKYILTVSVSTYAGTGDVGYADGTAASARFNYPVGLELAHDGNLIVVDYWNHSIRMISTDGNVSTLAGNGTAGYSDGTGSDAHFFRPIDLAFDVNSGFFVTDFGNHRIRHISFSGDVTTIAGSLAGYRDGLPHLAQFRFPAGIALADNDTLYVSDSENNIIRWIAPNGVVGTHAGSGRFGFENGFASQAQFRWPFGMDAGSDQRLFIADHTNHSIRIISSVPFVSTFSGNGEPGFSEGIPTDTRFNSPYDVTVDSSGYVYVADYLNHRIRMISPSGLTTTLAGNGEAAFIDGDETEARFNHPIGLAVNNDGSVLFVADHHNHAIRKITVK